MRTRFASLSLAAVLSGVMLTGCSSAPAPDHCEPRLTSGALSSNVQVNGGFDSAPDIKIPQGFTFGNSQVTFTERAADRRQAIQSDSVATVNFALFESASGQIIEQNEGFGTGTGTSFVPVRPGEEQGAFLDALECAAPGDRLVAVFSPAEAQAISGRIGAPPETALVILVDVHAVQPVKVQGSPRALPFGFPSVVTDETGQPGIVSTPEPAPTTVKVATRITGSGPVVKASDNIVANSMQVTWLGRLVDNSWPTGPTFIGNEESPLSAVREHLTGQTVGSQVIVLVPSDTGSADIHVVDILAAG